MTFNVDPPLAVAADMVVYDGLMSEDECALTKSGWGQKRPCRATYNYVCYA